MMMVLYNLDPFYHDIYQEKPNTPTINYRPGTNHFSPNIVDFNGSYLIDFSEFIK